MVLLEWESVQLGSTNHFNLLITLHPNGFKLCFSIPGRPRFTDLIPINSIWLGFKACRVLCNIVVYLKPLSSSTQSLTILIAAKTYRSAIWGGFLFPLP